MIQDLDATIKIFLQGNPQTGLSGEGESEDELKEATISFAVPDKDWQKNISDLALNIYLYDIRENRKLRTNEREYQHNSDGTITQKKPAPRIDCAYLITAWNKSESTTSLPDKEEKVFQQHHLLSQVLSVLLRHPTIPSKYLQGDLAGQEPSLPVIAAQHDGLPDPVKFWDALGSPLRPSITCVITIALDIKEKEPEPTQKVRINPIVHIKEEVVQIRGRIMNDSKRPKSIAGAEVTIPELQQTTRTDADGYYTFNNLPPGNFTITSSASGYQSQKITVIAPVPMGHRYDITMSKGTPRRMKKDL